MKEQAYFEDFNVGDRVLTPARRITETDLALFNALAGNSFTNGLYPLVISEGLMFLAGDRGIPRSTIALWGLERVVFAAPAKAGNAIHVEAEVTEKTQVAPMRGLVAMSHSLKNQRGEEILRCTSKILAGRRPATAAAQHG